ncbi:dihydrodipicolinate synthase family protein [Ornithinimicrobium cryptoxanthini]|uniref:Dihydrodipicolinate synthase family protein n=1 Tax=Ornithinimicrobium cryptoxanthini TaxID=2934161 RepID=A0ABY4YJV5_9MICO|nr:dihydrodipicolinate synthase family protein [Ornithinimicrobium cryptoxanthini]USQ76988.1 dihydrodipicolinate synthase family protein [Ornithinimicrobium cryptoxanthini]
MTGHRITGVVPPVLTPFTADGEIDLPSLERLVTRMIEAGVDGLFALGSSSETAYLDDSRRVAVLEAVMGIAAGRVPVLAGVIETQLERVLTQVRVAERLGAAGVVATAPFYAITGPDETEAHFRGIAAATDLPVWAYDIPVCTHLKLGADLLVRLGAEGVLTGVKDSSGDDVGFRRLAMKNRAAGEPLSLLTGHEVVVDGAYLAGAHGSVPGLGNVDPAGYVRMHRAARDEDWVTVRAEQDRLAALFEIVFVPGDKVGTTAGIGAFKTALRHLGVIETNVMSPPMVVLNDDHARRIGAICDAVAVGAVASA